MPCQPVAPRDPPMFSKSLAGGKPALRQLATKQSAASAGESLIEVHAFAGRAGAVLP